jgi:hypothetical protein
MRFGAVCVCVCKYVPLKSYVYIQVHCRNLPEAVYLGIAGPRRLQLRIRLSSNRRNGCRDGREVVFGRWSMVVPRRAVDRARLYKTD